MFITTICAILAFILGVCLRLFPGFDVVPMVSQGCFASFFLISIFFSLFPWFCMLFLSQGAETSPITMAALRSNVDDRKLSRYAVLVLIVSLLGSLLSLQSVLPTVWSFVGETLCVGLVLDLVRLIYLRFQFRRTPEGIVDWFKEVMFASVQKKDEQWHAISFEIPFGTMMAYIRGGAYGSLRLFCHAICDMAGLWLGSFVRLVLFQVPGEFEESLLERYSQAEMMTAKRVAWILQESCELGSIPGVEEITRLAGKLIVTFHGHNSLLGTRLLHTLANFPNKTTGKIALRDLDMEVMTTISEVMQALLERFVKQKVVDSEFIREILREYDRRLSEIFRREKNIDMALFVQPVLKLEHMIRTAVYDALPGRDDLLQDCRRLVVQYS